LNDSIFEYIEMPKDQYIFLESKFAIYSNGIYTFNLEQNITPKNEIRLAFATIPDELPNISPQTNTLSVSINGLSYTTTITPGTYDVDSLSAAISEGLTDIGVGTMSCTYNDTTQRLQIQSSVTMTITGGTILQLIGFNSGQTGTTLTATSAPDLSQPNALYINIINIGNGTINTCKYGSTFVVPLTNGSGSYNTFYEKSMFTQSLDLGGIKQFFSQFQISLFSYVGNSPQTYNTSINFTMMLAYN
jgi:hypothetical protein